MKICTTCKIEKSISEFNKNKARKDGYNNICRACSNERSKRYYEENKIEHLKVIQKRKKRTIKDNQRYIIELLTFYHCQDCGNKDVRVLEFDHVRGRKKDNVSKMVANGLSLETIKEEIDKCDIVCANCHRIRTYKRSETYRNV